MFIRSLYVLSEVATVHTSGFTKRTPAGSHETQLSARQPR